MEKTKRRRISRTTSPRIQSLPTEIFQDILSRLPLKYIYRCLSVCSSWRNSISTMDFYNLHYTRSLTTTNLIVRYRTQLYYIPNLNWDRPVELKNIPFQRRIPNFDVVSPCNGFLCVTDITHARHGIYIGNPMMGDNDWYHIPTAYDYPYDYGFGETMILGFGYEKKLKEYKVVNILSDRVKRRGLEVRIHTVGTSGWRKLGNINKLVFHSIQKSGVLLHGNLYFLGYSNSKCTSVSIVAVSLADEKLHGPFPLVCDMNVVLPHAMGCGFYLVELGGNLGVVDDSRPENVYVWIMREYGNSKSMGIRYIINRHPPMNDGNWYRFRPLVVVGEGGELLLQRSDGAFFCCLPTTGNLTPSSVLREIYMPQFQPAETLDFEELVRAVTHVGTFLLVDQAIRETKEERKKQR